MATDVLLEISGDPAAIAAFVDRCLAGNRFSFEGIAPTPDALKVDEGSLAEDGFDAVAGDWTKVAGRAMLREHATALGWPFPLGSRAQVIACYNALGPIGASQLALGQQIQANIEAYGHGCATAWRKAHWGIECDVTEVIVAVSGGQVDLAFDLLGTPPKNIFSQLSKSHPTLRISVLSVNETGKRAAEFVLRGGKQLQKGPVDPVAARDRIWRFRIGGGLDWLGRVSGGIDMHGLLRLNEAGRVFFEGVDMSVNFALRRLHAGTSVAQFSSRHPDLSDRQVEALRAVFQAGYR